MTQGPEETTGRFSTREDLTRHVIYLMRESDLTRKQIAEDCKVSPGTVQFIIKLQQGKKDSVEFLAMKKKLLYKLNWSEVLL